MIVSELILNPDAEDHEQMTLKRRVQMDRSVLWALCLRGWVWDWVEGAWVHEPTPSYRTDEFLQRTRRPWPEILAGVHALFPVVDLGAEALGE